MATKLHRHFDVDGNELPPTYIEVSDEELQEGARDARIQELLNKPSTSSSETQQLIALLARKQGFTVPANKDVSRR